MNIPVFMRETILRLRSLRRFLRFTQATVLTGGVLFLAILVIATFAWDAYLFIQAISPPQPVSTEKSGKVSLTSQDIDDAIRILDQRQKQLDTLLKGLAGATTLSF